MFDLDVGHLDTPGVGLLIEDLLNISVEPIPFRQQLVEFVFTENRAQRGLRQLAGGIARRSHVGGAAMINSGVSATLALIEFAMKQWASTLSMILRAGSSSASLLRVTRGRTVTSVM